MDKAKPFDIPKWEVWEAFKKVKANQGAAGVDGQSVADFEANLSNNLYKLWNRMSYQFTEIVNIKDRNVCSNHCRNRQIQAFAAAIWNRSSTRTSYGLPGRR